MEFDILPGEAFYGGAVMDGINQPYTQASERELDLTRNQTPNQMMPLLGVGCGTRMVCVYCFERGAFSVPMGRF